MAYSVTLDATRGAPYADPSTTAAGTNTVRQRMMGPRREAGTNRRCTMRRTLTVIAALIGALFTLLALGGTAMAATAVEYALTVAP